MQLIVRADATSAIGSGHLMRCLALAQAWAGNKDSVHFVSRCESASISASVRGEGFVLHAVQDVDAGWDAIEDLVKAEPGSALVLDGYGFNAADHERGRSLGMPVLAIDDNAHLPNYAADLIVNQNPYANELCYSAAAHSRLLLGTQYALLRREFAARRLAERECRENACRILVTLGGSDPDNVSLKVVEACQQTTGTEACVVAGPANCHLDELRSAVRGDSRIHIETATTAMSRWMAWAEMAVIGAGSTCWECCYMGLPAITIVLAENQKRIAEWMAEARITVNLGWHTEVSVARISRAIGTLAAAQPMRTAMNQRGQKLVDGRGAARVAQALWDIATVSVERTR
jgi:UDP-2,4-diacetamido-2,4,6-trideoxy-beta-L-altropyranose hydrolase